MAEALFQEGRKLLEQKRYADACPKFAESQRLDPGIGTLLNLAACHELEGKTATAWSEFTQAVGLAEREGRPNAGQFARTHLAALTPKLAKISIAVPKENEAPDLEITLDGQALGRPAWGLLVPIDPGTHLVAATASGKKRWSSQTVFNAGDQRTVTVPPLENDADANPPSAAAPLSQSIPPTLAPPPTIAPAAPDLGPAPSRAPPDTGGASRAQRTAGLVVGGAGLLAMGGGVVLGLSAKGTYNDAECDASGCTPMGLDARSKAVGRGQVATAIFALGAGAAVGGAVLWLTAPAGHQIAGASARIGLAPAGAFVSGTW